MLLFIHYNSGKLPGARSITTLDLNTYVHTTQADGVLYCFHYFQIVEQKGLDIVRRDWCPLAKDVGNVVLNGE